MNCRNVEDIPIKTQPSKTLYQNIKTFTLKKKFNSNIIKVDDNIPGFASRNKFNPQDLGLPK